MESKKRNRNINLTKEQQDKLNSMECEKINTSLDNVNLDIIIRQLGGNYEIIS